MTNDKILLVSKQKSGGKRKFIFRKLLKLLTSNLQEIPDTRQLHKIKYTLKDTYLSMFAMFYLQDPSLLEFQRRIQEKIQTNNLKTIFGIENIPSDTQIRTIIDSHSYAHLHKAFTSLFRLLQRGKKLEPYRFLKNRYLITIDGSEYFSSENISCQKCLRKKGESGKQRFYHQMVQATLVHPELREVIPLSPEFIRNSDGTNKQDCELNAGKRIVNKIKRDHKMLPIIIVGDGLYSNQPYIKEVTGCGFSYILVAKQTNHKHLFEEIHGFDAGGYLESIEHKENKRRYHYKWINNVDLTGGKETIIVNYVEISIYNGTKRTYYNSWITDIEITEENVKEIVRGGRARWKIENEAFNTLKNHGYHLEHNYGHGENNLSEAFFLLNLLAFFIHQILTITDKLYREARSHFSARKEYWNAVRALLRVIIFESWEHMLKRMNSPPKKNKNN